jgi:recombination protein RecA
MPPKKKAAADSGKGKNVHGVINQLKSKYPGRVFGAAEYTMPWKIKRLPTGVLDLDIALGGGLPAGGMSFFTGKQGSGKNWLVNQVIRLHQERHGAATAVAVVSTEMMYDKEFAQACGVKIAFSPQEVAEFVSQYREDVGEDPSDEMVAALTEQIGEFITVPPSLAEESLQIAIDLIASREFDLVVIDSFGSLLTEHDDEGDMGDANRVGGAALLNTKFSRKLNYALAPDKDGNPNLTCIIGINQVRDNTDRANKYSPKTLEAGGWALKHARWVTVEISPRAKIKDGKELIGKTVGWEITKQKAGGHEGAQGTFDFFYALCGIDREMHTVTVAAEHGVLKRSGAYYSYEGNQIGQGAAAAAEFVRANDGLLESLEIQTRIKAGVRCSYG